MANVTFVYADPIATFGESEIPFVGIMVAFAVIAIAQLCAISIMSWEPRVVFHATVDPRRSSPVVGGARRKQRGARLSEEDGGSGATQEAKQSPLLQPDVNRVEDLSCSDQGRRARSEERSLEEGGGSGDDSWRMVELKKALHIAETASYVNKLDDK